MLTLVIGAHISSYALAAEYGVPPLTDYGAKRSEECLQGTYNTAAGFL